MPRKGKLGRDIETYSHAGKERANNPPVGLVTPETDRDASRRTFAHDPHIDPELSWAGKAEHTSFEVPTVSLHVHERIDPRTIVEAVRKRRASEAQLSLFAMPEENPPLRQAIEFYRHRHNWTNRLVAGDQGHLKVSVNVLKRFWKLPVWTLGAGRVTLCPCLIEHTSVRAVRRWHWISLCRR